ncbi:ABC transporter ATP-binding protein [Plantactinospora sonchi]|uniref:ABC transporter ATP-binding protein n=1 Tax=Plantactinospora sonchi TaxID=1544735 RepID=A0ABU7RVD9_9ACTN
MAGEQGVLPVADAAQVRRYARTLFRRHPRGLAAVLGLHALAAITGLAAPRLLGELVERVSAGTTTVTVDRVALAIGGFVLAQAVLIRFAHFASARLGERVLAELREEFVERILALPLSTVERAGTGDLLTRTTRDVATLSRSVRFAVPETLIAIVTAILVVGAILLTSPMLLLPGLVSVPLFWFATRWYLRRAGPGYLAESAAYADITDGISETVEGSRSTEALGQQRRRRARTDTDIGRSYAAERYTMWLRTVFFPLAEVGYVLPVVVTLLCGGWFYLQGWVSLGEVTAVTLYVQQLMDPIDRLLSWLDEVQVGGASLARLLGVSSGSPASEEGPGPSGGEGRAPSVRSVSAGRVRVAPRVGRPGCAVLLPGGAGRAARGDPGPAAG